MNLKEKSSTSLFFVSIFKCRGIISISKIAGGARVASESQPNPIYASELYR